jgi:hypothetical protein
MSPPNVLTQVLEPRKPLMEYVVGTQPLPELSYTRREIFFRRFIVGLVVVAGLGLYGAGWVFGIAVSYRLPAWLAYTGIPLYAIGLALALFAGCLSTAMTLRNGIKDKATIRRNLAFEAATQTLLHTEYLRFIGKRYPLLDIQAVSGYSCAVVTWGTSDPIDPVASGTWHDDDYKVYPLRDPNRRDSVHFAEAGFRLLLSEAQPGDIVRARFTANKAEILVRETNKQAWPQLALGEERYERPSS